MPENSISDIKKYLMDGSTDTLNNLEFMEFWNSLTDEEKEEYKNTPLPKSE